MRRGILIGSLQPWADLLNKILRGKWAPEASVRAPDRQRGHQAIEVVGIRLSENQYKVPTQANLMPSNLPSEVIEVAVDVPRKAGVVLAHVPRQKTERENSQ